MTDGWVLAIDFGTTYTSAAMLSDDRVEVLEVDGQRRLPSVVLWLDDELVVGVAAESQRVLYPTATERNPKRYLGVRRDLLLDGTPIAVVDAVAAVLGAVVEEALRRKGGQPPADVRLTHPAQWGSTRLKALRVAAKRAGLTNVTLMAEPIAAAIHYGATRLAEGEYVGVYDLGGGTFDTAVLRRVPGGLELAGPPGGDDRLGGEDFDHRLMEHLLDQLAIERPEAAEALRTSTERQWSVAAGQLLTEVRQAKEALSRQTNYTVLIPPPVSVSLRITRPEFEALIQADVQSTVEEFAATVARAGLSVSDLSARFLTGGSSRVPLVARLMHETFGDAPDTFDDPKVAVALGAAQARRKDPAPTIAPPDDATAATAAATGAAAAAAAPVLDEPTTPEPTPGADDAVPIEVPLTGAAMAANAPPPPETPTWAEGAGIPPEPPYTTDADVADDGDSEPPEGDRKNKVLVFGAAVVALALLLGGLAFAMGGDGNGDDTDTTLDPDFTREDGALIMDVGSADLESGLETTQAWRLEGEDGDLFASEVTFTNPTDEEKTEKYYDVVPTEVAPTRQDAELIPTKDQAPGEWVDGAQVVRWNVKVPADGEVTVRYESAVSGSGLDEERMLGWAESWGEDKAEWEKPPELEVTGRQNEEIVKDPNVRIEGKMTTPGRVQLVGMGPNCDEVGEPLESGVNGEVWFIETTLPAQGMNCLRFEGTALNDKKVTNEIRLNWTPDPIVQPDPGTQTPGIDPVAPVTPVPNVDVAPPQPPPVVTPPPPPPPVPTSACDTWTPEGDNTTWDMYWGYNGYSLYFLPNGIASVFELHFAPWLRDPYGCGLYVSSVTSPQGATASPVGSCWCVVQLTNFAWCGEWYYFTVTFANASNSSRTRTFDVSAYLNPC